ncbi:MAG: membrane dipeptidase [Draconibacterium sp.]|nr:membrane dipeptidase [Draconibacterium sp.]
MKEGGLDAMFFAAFTSQRERTAENTENAYKTANQMIDATYAACNKYSMLAEVATKSSDASRIEKNGKRAIYIGMENGFPVGTDINRVKEFYKKGCVILHFATLQITTFAIHQPTKRGLNMTG